MQLFSLKVEEKKSISHYMCRHSEMVCLHVYGKEQIDARFICFKHRQRSDKVHNTFARKSKENFFVSLFFFD